MDFNLGKGPWNKRSLKELQELLDAYGDFIFENEEDMTFSELEEHEAKYDELKNHISGRS